MADYHSPERWSVNGEEASEADIASMERLATDFLIDIPTDCYRDYEYGTESGSFVLLSSREFEEQSENASNAKVIIAKGSPARAIFEIAFDYKNEPSHTAFESEASLPEITRTIQDLLENGGLEPNDSAILRHLQAIVFCRIDGANPDHIGILPDPDSAQDYRHVADVIRSQVKKNATYTVISKMWGTSLNDESLLNVSLNEFIGDISEKDDLDLLPCLVINYVDLAHHTHYTYSKDQDGDATLETGTTSDEEQDDDPTEINEDIEEEVALFVRELRASIPGEKEVRLITDILREAIHGPIEQWVHSN